VALSPSGASVVEPKPDASNTLQRLCNTERMFKETTRVGRIGIVAFPDFAHWPNRLHVTTGRMPVTRARHCQWYDTPNLLASMAVFKFESV
jgi:methionine biosynthesis protein MetW